MMTKFDEELGAIIRAEREAHGLSLQQMADALVINAVCHYYVSIMQNSVFYAAF